ncbi:hypothetical protein ACIRBX_12280 [Kitasatospora sp. NPDC096147]|uniref:hypothetical protein n=1 Tax=Kitasatospora sp. NPDC096147 TaxID=3364093 RepID=UPI003830E29A
MDHEDARGSALTALAALLDRSIEQIAQAAEDGRTYDRGRIVSLSDLWDNAAVPLLRAVTAATPAEREDRARALLRAMVTRRPQHRERVLEQVGGQWADLLPTSRPAVPQRDFFGVVRPAPSVCTPEAWAGLTADYELGAAGVRRLWVEQEGAAGASGTLELSVGRRYPATATASGAVLAVQLHGLTEARFDHTDRHGAVLTCGAGGVTVRLGRGGVLRAAGAVLSVEDHRWHESAAGRRADAVTPPNDPPRPRPAPAEEPELAPAAGRVARVLGVAMMEIRSVRSAAEVGRVPVAALCRMLAGAGGALVATAGDEAALGRLYEEWRARRPVREDGEPSPLPGRVRFASWSAARDGRRAEAVVVLASAPGGPGGLWLTSSYEHPEPAVFRVELTGGQLSAEVAG